MVPILQMGKLWPREVHVSSGTLWLHAIMGSQVISDLHLGILVGPSPTLRGCCPCFCHVGSPSLSPHTPGKGGVLPAPSKQLGGEAKQQETW